MSAASAALRGGLLLAACLVSFLVPPSARAQDAEDAQAQAKLEQLEAARKKGARLLREVESRRRAVLDALDEADEARRTAERTARQAGEAAKAVATRLATAEAEEQVVLGEREKAAREVGPRLGLRYRLRGASYLQALVTAPTVGDFLWRRRMLDRILAGELAAIERLARVQDRVTAARAQVQAERDALVAAREAARAAADAAAAETEAQRVLLAGLGREKATYERLLAESERARSALLAELEGMPAAPAGLGGFGARKGRLAMPAPGRIEVPFGRRVDPKTRTVVEHKGVDIRADKGTEVKAVHPATVGFAGWFKGFGNLVVLDHGEGWYTLYAHLDALAVERGAQIADGHVLGTVGDTASLKGAYLYFEIRQGQQPVNPRAWLRR